jgi:acyl-coenzyme A synthetase/AMP-(fatty) acid ligase
VLVVEDGTTAECIATLAVDDLYEEAVGATVLTPRLDSAAPALLVYTGGTTGVPKGLMLDPHPFQDPSAETSVTNLRGQNS